MNEELKSDLAYLSYLAVEDFDGDVFWNEYLRIDSVYDEELAAGIWSADLERKMELDG